MSSSSTESAESADSIESADSTESEGYSGWAFRLLQGIFKIILYLPWVWMALFALFVLGAAMQVGHLPVYGQPDPKDAGAISFLYMPVMIAMLLIMGSSPIGIGLALVRLLRGVPSFIRRGEVVAYLVGIGLFFVIISSDFAGLITWLGD